MHGKLGVQTKAVAKAVEAFYAVSIYRAIAVELIGGQGIDGDPDLRIRIQPGLLFGKETGLGCAGVAGR
jgi:hypothetical protein